MNLMNELLSVFMAMLDRMDSDLRHMNERFVRIETIVEMAQAKSRHSLYPKLILNRPLQTNLWVIVAQKHIQHIINTVLKDDERQISFGHEIGVAVFSARKRMFFP